LEKILLCWSGGKDSALALYELRKSRKYEVISLLTTITEGYDRVSLHGVRRALVEKQASSLGLPLEEVFIPRDCPNQEYESRMRTALARFKEAAVLGVAFGDIFLEEVRSYREANLSRLEMKGLFPLWGRDSAGLVPAFIALGFRAVTTCVDASLLDDSFAGRMLDREFLTSLPEGIDPAGENGEFHSFVFDGPIFKERISYRLGDKVRRDSLHFCDLLPG
jgi:uncharacterized protein (TIGR00290 family)